MVIASRTLRASEHIRAGWSGSLCSVSSALSIAMHSAV